ncbi:MAG TPA: acetolactate synthase large subunit [Bryobacteraceae bacterium]|nr:acetolactate synthase large subunit [Bryobacteraceae bacterium]
MTGAECLLRTLVAHGVDLCLMNPGTSEMQFVSALDRAPEMRGVLCLFEGVCSGAADGYARMLRRPAATLAHLGPGLGNALANFHNARKARSPVVSIVGEHSTAHLPYNAPLTADITAFARGVSCWIHTLARAEESGEMTAAAVRAAYGPPGQVATLIVPADFSWSDGGEPVEGVSAFPNAAVPDARRVRQAAMIMNRGSRAGLLLSGGALLESGLVAAGRIAAATGARVFADRFAARLTRGGGLFAPERIPYFPEPAEAALAGLEDLVLVEAEQPVSFFGYPGRRSTLAPEACRMHTLATPAEDGTAALAALAEECGASPAAPHATCDRPLLPGDGALTLDAIGRAIGALLPDGAIVSDEMVSSGERVLPWLAAVRHHHLPVTGGAIGQGLPVALGAALACPDRKVVALEADGSAMYTLQALWTMARERLDVVTVIFANRRYRILEIETRRTGAGEIGPRAAAMMDIGQPDLDWVKVAEAQGVAGERTETAGEFVDAFRRAMAERGPRLIEAVLDR